MTQFVAWSAAVVSVSSGQSAVEGARSVAVEHERSGQSAVEGARPCVRQ